MRRIFNHLNCGKHEKEKIQLRWPGFFKGNEKTLRKSPMHSYALKNAPVTNGHKRSNWNTSGHG
ncbi:hypothetical protein IUD24_01450 [Xylella fastidiosa subsp. multiplex]|uniref:hypothetical protein n=1 Tax=Xylella fastidiosa TaxID=2371 RepID=UPI00138A13EF|nr:hypothetical protein [Xylella fastidiosa]QPC00467.1 hypothetical protein IUD24_01450 [Xylella fastidiosa subsp. multiplex]UIT45906.1 hypothetical protein LZ751_01460 [Xylella fastidiosa subsp. multiplex]